MTWDQLRREAQTEADVEPAATADIQAHVQTPSSLLQDKDKKEVGVDADGETENFDFLMRDEEGVEDVFLAALFT